jgi:uncharacterized protein (DUF1697 family)
MLTYLSLLRGINVGPKNRVKMDALVDIYASLGFSVISTYLQSGNIVFSSETADSARLALSIEQKIKQTTGLQVVIILRTPGDLKKVVSNNPYLVEHGIDQEALYVTFLASPVRPDSLPATEAQGQRDKYIIQGSEIYLFCPDGYGRTKYSNDYFERKLNVIATTRNWKTVNALLALATNPISSFRSHQP